jgi:tetratricopeptide (TPR) repeat protein
VLLAAGLRLLAMEQTFPTRPIGDELYYIGTAINLAEGRGHISATGNRALRPPAFSFLVSRFVDVARLGRKRDPAGVVPRLERLDPSLPDPRLRDFLRPLTRLQVVLGTLLVALTALLGRALFDARTGLLAGFVAAVDPSFIAFSHYLWSDALFAVLIASALIGLVYGADRRSWGLAAATGLVFGAAGLTRQFAIPIAGTGALWWLAVARRGERWGALGRGALMLGVVALLILPWTYRNHTLFDRLVPVAAVGSLALAGGNTLESPDWRQPHGPALRDFNRRYFAIRDEMERMDFGRRWALDRIGEEQPTWILKKAVRNLPLLLSPDSIFFYKLRFGAYDEIPTPILRWLVIATVASFVLVVASGVLGIAGAEGKGRRLLPGMLLGVVLLVHVISTANARHRLPWMPLLMVYASFALLELRALPWRSVRRRAVVPLVLFLGCFGLSLPEFAPVASELWTRSDDASGVAPPGAPRGRSRPDSAAAHANIGLELMEDGRFQDARRHLERSLSLGLEAAEVHAALGSLALRRADPELAVRHLRRAVRDRPDLHSIANNLAWLLATSPSERMRDPEEAIRIAEATVGALQEPNAAMLDTLAAGYAAAGRFDAAIRTAAAASALARETGDAAQADEIAARLVLYRSHTAYIDRPEPAED